MGVTLLHLNVLQFAQAGAQAVQQGVHVLGGVVGAEADTQRGADGQVIAAHGLQGVAGLALIAGAAAGDEHQPPVEVVDEGLAVDAAGGEVDHLIHGVIGGIQRDAGQLGQAGAQLSIQGMQVVALV